jgi:SAM-dependent methyltransferase
MTDPLSMYGDGLLRAGQARLRLRDGTMLPLPLDRYLGPPDATDQRLLTGLTGPVLDVGCGPGRHLHALAAQGVFALGVDLSPIAVALARGRGTRAIVASIFQELPGAGAWRSALLLDGNVGIGGSPPRLLARIRNLLREDGELLIELERPGVQTGATFARIETCEGVSSWFRWARVSIADLERLACAAGFPVRSSWSLAGRFFARLGLQGRGQAIEYLAQDLAHPDGREQTLEEPADSASADPGGLECDRAAGRGVHHRPGGDVGRQLVPLDQAAV